MAGDGLIPPLNAPPAGQVLPGVQPGTSQAVVIANIVIIFGPTGSATGLFVYQPGTTPGAGNPPIAWITANTVDPYGNTIQPGIMLAEASGTGHAEGGIIWNSATPGAAEPLLALYPNATVGFTGNSPFVLGRVFNRGLVNEYLGLALGGGGTAGSSPVQVELFSQSKDGTILGHTSFYDWASTNLIADMNILGLVAANPSVANTNETWHTMSPLSNGWAAVAGNVANQYRLVASPPHSVEIIGVLSAAAATTSTFFTLPAGYRPAHQQQFAVGANSGVTAGNSAFIQCATSGALTVIGVGTGAANTAVYHGFISLDA